MADFDIAHVTFAAADKGTGAITCHVGDVLSGETYDVDATVFQSWGWLAIPAPPIAGVSAAEAVILKTGDADIVVGGRSVRSAAIAGLLKSGESAAFADGSQACTLYKLDGSVIQFSTHDNTKDGRSVFQSTGPEGWEFSWPWGRTIVDKSGWSTLHVNGASIHCGSADLSGPFAALSSLGLTSYVALTAPLVRINGTVVSLGPDTGVAEPVVKAVSLLAVLDAMSAVLAAMVSVAVPPVPAFVTPPPAALPVFPTLTMAGLIATAVSAIAAAHATIGSTSVSTT